MSSLNSSFASDGTSITAEGAVREYAQLIEAGRIEAATRLVPLKGDLIDAGAVADGSSHIPFPLDGPLVDQHLLTDDFYGKAQARFTLDNVYLSTEAPNDTSPGDTVTVDVLYSVGTRSSKTQLEVQRLHEDGWFGIPQWRVKDSLALAVSLPVAGSEPTTLSIDGTSVLTNPTWNDQLETGPSPSTDVSTFMYPGQYAVGGASITYRALAPQLILVTETDSLTPDYLAGGTVEIGLAPQPTPALYELVDARISELLTECTTYEGAQRIGADGSECPYLLDWSGYDEGDSYTASILVMPQAIEFWPTQLDPGGVSNGKPTPVFSFETTLGSGQINYSDGTTPPTTTIATRGSVYITGDDVRVVIYN